jgi:peptide/nickel transport system substrate-binding protein
MATQPKKNGRRTTNSKLPASVRCCSFRPAATYKEKRKMKSNRKVWFMVLLLLTAVVLAACSGTQTASPTAAPTQPVSPTQPAAATQTPSQEPPAAGGVLRVALPNFPNSLDVSSAAERNAQNAAWQLYDSLVWINEVGEMEPALAEHWDVSADGTEYTFHLRQGVTFHNGEPFNAAAVIFSWERGKRDDMQWSDRWARAVEMEAVDEFTVVMRTENPDPLFLGIMAQHWGFVPPNYIAEVGEDGFNNHPVGTGPFMFVEWLREDRIVFEANPNYWRAGYPMVQTLIFRPIPESSTRAAAIRTGEIDIVNRLSAEQAAALEGAAGVQIIRYPVDRVFYIAFNNLTSGIGQPTENVLVRQAMNHAVDREAIIEALFDGAATPSTGFLTPGNLGYNTALSPYAYDPGKARDLLREAGYPDGFEMDFACPAGAYTNFEQVCEAIQGFLGEVGIRVNLEIMESGRYWDLEAEKALPPIFGDSWSERSGEALPRLLGALGGWDASFSAWSDPVIDDYLAQIGTTIDREARAALYTELHTYMYDNPPFIYLYSPETFEAIRTNVQNYHPRAAEDYFLFQTSIGP